MNLLKSPRRRVSAVLAGAVIGMAGVVAFAAPASAHSPTIGGAQTCLKDGHWTIDWSVGNDYPADAYIKSLELTNGATITGPVTEKTDGHGAVIKANSADNPADQVHGTTTVSDDVNSVTLTVWLTWPADNYENSHEKTIYKPEDCTAPSTPPSTPPPSTPGEPTPILSQDCTTMTVGLSNPANGETITLHFKTSKGEARTDVIKPGESKSEKFSAVPGFTVTLTADGIEGSETVAYQKPANCSTGGEGGGLPVTGPAAGGIAGGAALLLIAGGVLFFVARRRKVKFTA